MPRDDADPGVRVGGDRAGNGEGSPGRGPRREATIRPAGLDDADAIVAVLASVAAEGRWIAAEAPFDRHERAQRLRTAMIAGQDVPWVVQDRAGRVVGCGMLHETPAGGVLALGMALVSGARGAGLGRRLLEALIEHAEAVGAHKLELEVWPDNAPALALYVAYGFSIEGLRRDHYRRRDGTLRSALLLARPLGGGCASA